MAASKLKNTANKTESVHDLKKYKKERNFVVKLNNNCKKVFFLVTQKLKTIQNRFGVNASRTFLKRTLKAITIQC